MTGGRMKRLLIIVLVIFISIPWVHASEKTLLSITPQSIERAMQEETKKMIKKHRRDVIDELGTFYGHYRVLRYEMSKKTSIENVFGWLAGGRNYKQMKFYKQSYESTARLLAKVAWPESYKAGGWIRKDQIKNMKGILPNRNYSKENFLERIAFTLTQVFPHPHNPDKFYTQAMDEIKEIGERFFYLQKDTINGWNK